MFYWNNMHVLAFLVLGCEFWVRYETGRSSDTLIMAAIIIAVAARIIEALEK